MKNAKIIEALKQMNMAINTIIEELGDTVDDTATVAEPKEATKVEKKKAPAKATKKVEEPVEEVVEETEEVEEEGSEVSVEEIKAMGYNVLKKFAQSIGVKAVGTRDQILGKVLEAMDGEEETEEVEIEKEDEEKVVPISKGKKAGLKKKAEETEEDEMDEVEKAVREEAKDMDVTDIAELLQSIGIKASGKKPKLVELLVEAVKDGKLDFSSDDESEEEAEVEAEEEEEVDFTQYHEEYDPNGLNAEMSKKRAKAVKSLIEREVKAIEAGETTEKDIKDFLDTMLTEDEAEEYDVESLDENNLVFLYLELMKAMVDDDGEEHEPSDPYTIGEENVCCGHALEYDEESEQYICQSCGANYEAE